MLTVVLAYYWHEPTRGALDILAQWKARYGYAFSILLSIFAGAVLPEVLKILFFQSGRMRRENVRELIFAAVLWGVMVRLWIRSIGFRPCGLAATLRFLF